MITAFFTTKRKRKVKRANKRSVSDRRELTIKRSRWTGRKQRGVLEKHEHTKEQGKTNKIGSKRGTVGE